MSATDGQSAGPPRPRPSAAGAAAAGPRAPADGVEGEGPVRRSGSDAVFLACLAVLGGVYLLLIMAMLAADAAYTSGDHILAALRKPEIQFSIKLSLISCSLTAIISLWIAVPAGYLMSRFDFPGKAVVDAILDIPIVLPPLVVGLSLLILFQTPFGRAIESVVPVTYAVPSVIIAQVSVAAAFAVRTMRVAFDQIDVRGELVAMTLGAGRAQAFWRVAFPQATRGMLTAATLAWARALGEFGPILVFSGATRMKTEVLPTTVFLELAVGDLKAAVAVSFLMVAAAIVVLVLVRAFGMERAKV